MATLQNIELQLNHQLLLCGKLFVYLRLADTLRPAPTPAPRPGG